MSPKSVGTIMKHRHERVVILKTGLRVHGADAVTIARLSTTRPADTVPCVEARTWYDGYWVRLDQVSTVKATELISAWTGPGKLPPEPLASAIARLEAQPDATG
ncbi:hypothetical protein KCV87_33430 [Actinosynnema pretiosum subsp. pretiosum]|uniref:Uncharacterized protein n=2 Tax=Actinosynnema TaxID=40566 RepID=C6WK90_ACTMD|nr:hypothetical protein [Actinosynnema mirum]ACU38303.1 hypothetical protein Amir_4457 [Actinosynnema mirum DSM 43827]AXX31825.1 hypothetical protein APASM_4460 [Actinosynnema pretiosum subsp. pretiosum]QUF04185.1 hypothetical protein KCV87_33430 [Actinosynnema pretiosum subsp. pretiosum]